MNEILSEDDLDRALAALHADVRTDEMALADGRSALMAAAAAPQPARSRSKGRWLVAAAAAAALVAGGLVVQGVEFGDQSTGNHAAAAGLNASADKIAAADPPVRPGQYLYIGQREWGIGSIKGTKRYLTAHVERRGESWAPADRSHVWLHRREHTGRYKWIVGTDAEMKQTGITFGEPELGGPNPLVIRARCGDFFLSHGERPCEPQGYWGNPKPDWIAGLPRDPRKLYDRLRADVGDRGDAAMLTYAADALRSGLLPADLRAALYRALARIPGLQITQQQANLDGRIGVAYGMEKSSERVDIIIDQRTGQFIGERMVQKGPDKLTGVPAGTVLRYSSVATAVVNRIGVRPTR